MHLLPQRNRRWKKKTFLQENAACKTMTWCSKTTSKELLQRSLKEHTQISLHFYAGLTDIAHIPKGGCSPFGMKHRNERKPPALTARLMLEPWEVRWVMQNPITYFGNDSCDYHVSRQSNERYFFIEFSVVVFKLFSFNLLDKFCDFLKF